MNTLPTHYVQISQFCTNEKMIASNVLHSSTGPSGWVQCPAVNMDFFSKTPQQFSSHPFPNSTISQWNQTMVAQVNSRERLRYSCKLTSFIRKPIPLSSSHIINSVSVHQHKPYDWIFSSREQLWLLLACRCRENGRMHMWIKTNQMNSNTDKQT